MCDTSVRISKLMNKYPDKVPIVIDDLDENIIKKKKYLIPRSYTVGQFMTILKNNSTLKKYQAIFLMFDNILAPCSADIGSIYDMYYDTHNHLLYATIPIENTFG